MTCARTPGEVGCPNHDGMGRVTRRICAYRCISGSRLGTLPGAMEKSGPELVGVRGARPFCPAGYVDEPGMIGSREIVIVSLLGLLTTSSSILGAALGLYIPLSKRMLACVLAFAAGALISALTIELAFEGAQELHQHGFGANAAWGFIASGFALGSIIYYFTSLFLDQRGAAIRYPTRFREYALGRKQKDAKGNDSTAVEMRLLRHLPPEEVERILPLRSHPPSRRW